MSTLESFESTNPREDWWPIDDVWAYHDWHSGGNGTTAPFMAEIEREFGAPISLPDFERKAQMLNYVNHRAIFEGMNANLWAPNSGRLLWMTQPSWPSTMWQILSADYDTQASFYGTKKACEPLHVQLNLADYQVDAVNTTPNPHPGLTVVAQVYSLTGALLSEKKAPLELAADQRTPAFRLDLAAQLAHGMVLVRLELLEGSGTVLSRNLYWLGGKPADARALTRLDPMPVQIKTTRTGERSLTVTVTNPGAQPSFENKLTLTDQDGRRILPVYYTDNYISLLPGESQTIQIEIPQQSQNTKLKLALRGWNTIPQVALVP